MLNGDKLINLNNLKKNFKRCKIDKIIIELKILKALIKCINDKLNIT